MSNMSIEKVVYNHGEISKVLMNQQYIPTYDFNEKIDCYDKIRIVQENICVGYIFIEKPNEDNPFYHMMKGYCKLIIAIDIQYRSKGYAKEAMNLLLKDHKILEGITKIEAIISNSNIPSIKLFTGLGFKKTYKADIDHYCYLFQLN